MTNLQHPLSLAREHRAIFTDTLHHLTQLTACLFALFVGIIYTVIWVCVYLYQFATDPLWKVRLLEGVLDLLNHLPPSLESDWPTAPVYAYLQDALDTTLQEVLGSEQDNDPTEPWVIEEQTALANEVIDELLAEEQQPPGLEDETFPRAASLLTEEDAAFLQATSDDWSGEYETFPRAASLFTEEDAAYLESRAQQEQQLAADKALLDELGVSYTDED